MNTSISYWYFTPAITPEQCNQIIDLGEKKLKSYKKDGLRTEATTFGKNSKQDKTDASSQKDLSTEEIKKIGLDKNNLYVRDSEVAWLRDDWLYDLVNNLMRQANQYAGWNFDIDCFEDFQFTKYNAPGGFYGWHQDCAGDWYSRYKRYIPGITHEGVMKKNEQYPDRHTLQENYINKVRKVSMTLNLSPENSYEGGNLKFDFGPHTSGERYKVCEEIRPQGSMVVFPSYEHHSVTPVTKGTRHSLVLWALGAPFK